MVLMQPVDVVNVYFVLQVDYVHSGRRDDAEDSLTPAHLLATDAEEEERVTPVPDVAEALVYSQVGEERRCQQVEEGL